MPAVKDQEGLVSREPEATGETDLPVLNFVEAPPAPEVVNCLLYGPPGSGKSTAAATAPGPILWVNCEGGNALAFARKVAQERETRILEVRIDPRDQAGMSAKQTLEEVYLQVRQGREPVVRTVVVDTVAKLREALALQIGGEQPTIQQWGQVSKALGGFVKALRALPVNLVLVAHEDISDDPDAGRIVRPLIGGAQSQIIPGEVDVVAYCRAVRGEDGVEYLGQLVEGRGRYAKDRSGGLGAVRPLDLSEWLAAFRDALGAGPVPWEEGFEELPEVDVEPEPVDEGAEVPEA